jgi:hypothetical protein
VPQRSGFRTSNPIQFALDHTDRRKQHVAEMDTENPGDRPPNKKLAELSDREFQIILEQASRGQALALAKYSVDSSRR